jgi:hypothetical protein
MKTITYNGIKIKYRKILSLNFMFSIGVILLYNYKKIDFIKQNGHGHGVSDKKYTKVSIKEWFKNKNNSKYKIILNEYI